MHPLSGTWVADPSKSQRHANHQFQSATMRFEISGSTVSLSYSGVNASGQREESAQMLCADGLEHGVEQAPGIVVINTLDERALHCIAHKDAAEVGRGTYEVSEDDQTMTAIVSGVDASGRPFDQVIVFDRDQSAGA
jgi:hypothetical protein